MPRMLFPRKCHSNASKLRLASPQTALSNCRLGGPLALQRVENVPNIYPFMSGNRFQNDGRQSFFQLAM
jgi:hypothetical protein